MPVYNAETTLTRMVDSIIAQTYNNWELIAVDDGSTDKSGLLLDEYSSSDDRIHVIHKQNGGVSMARQTGLDSSHGKYVIHADADDWVEVDMLEKLYRKAQEDQADVVFCDYYINQEDGKQYLKKQQPPTEPIEILQALFKYLHGSCWNKLVRRECYDRYNIRFPKGINYCEDLLTWVQLFLHPEIKISYLPQAFYHYCYYTNSGSICHTYTKNLFNQQVAVLNKLKEILGDMYPDIINNYKMSIKCGAFENPIFTSREYYKIFPELNREILKGNMSMFNKICMYLSYVGFYRLGTTLFKIKNHLLNAK